VLVDRKGRKFLLMLGTGGIVLALLAAGLLFRSAEAISAMSPVCCRRACRAIASIQLDSATLRAGCSASAGATTGSSNAAAMDRTAAPQQLTLAYSYGPFTNVQSLPQRRPALPVLRMSRADTVQPDSVIGAFFRKLHLNPFADPADAASAPLRIEQATCRRAIDQPWLAGGAGHVSVRGQLCGRPRRVRVAGTVRTDAQPHPLQRHEHRPADQPVRLDLHRRRLPAHGGPIRLRHAVLLWAGCSLLYFLTAALLLPETRGKTLEEIEAHFAGK
jgi:hypothetical protein